MNKVYWSNSYDDLKSMVSMKIQYELMRFLQDHHTLRTVVSEALGGSGPKPAEAPSDFSELASIISMAGGSSFG